MTYQADLYPFRDGPDQDDMDLLMATVRGNLIEKALSLDRSINAILGVQFQVNDYFATDKIMTRQTTIFVSGTPGTVVSEDVRADGSPMVSAPSQENEFAIDVGEGIDMSYVPQAPLLTTDCSARV
jgi:hypothetical protein